MKKCVEKLSYTRNIFFLEQKSSFRKDRQKKTDLNVFTKFFAPVRHFENATTIPKACGIRQRAYSIETTNMADGMEDLKLTVNKDFAKKLHKQKEKAELDQCKYCNNAF